ncbi:30S ribosomal protein S10 [Candidatus Peribacteria bacterium]|nr:30S ribosomal protein S10 [Candidatus Peribacteria bacterium]
MIPAKKAVTEKKAAKKATAPKAVKAKESVKKVEKPAAAKAAATAKAASSAAPAQTPKIKGIRIRLSAFDHTVLDEAALKIIDTALRTGAIVHGPIPLPTKLRKFTVNRSTFVHKDARDQFEMRIHRRLIDLSETTFKTVDGLQNLSLPSGVDIEIKMG